MIDLNNKVIKCLSEEHGKRIIQFFKDNGVDTRGKKGIDYIYHSVFCYYGIVHNVFDNYSEQEVEDASVEIIELPEYKPESNPVLTFPRKMYVWDGDLKPEVTYVINIVDNKVYAVLPNITDMERFEDEDCDVSFHAAIYQHACELDELDKVYSNPSTTSVDEQLSDIQVLRCEIEAISRKIDVMLNQLIQ